MSIESTIQKIEKKAALSRKLYPRVTDEKIRYILNVYMPDRYSRKDAYNEEKGYYIYSFFLHTFVPSESYLSYTVDVDIQEDTYATYYGLIEYGNLFLLKTDEGKYEYVQINKSGKNREYSFKVTPNIKSITVSFLKTDDVNDFKLEIERKQTVDITPYVISWPNLEVTQSRQGTSGVHVEVSSDMEFKDEAKDLVKELVEAYGLYAKATLDIHRRYPHNNEYELLKSVLIDFLEYRLTDDIATVGGTDISLQDIIESGKSTKFDIPVADIKEDVVWGYDRMELINSANYIVPELTSERVLREFVYDYLNVIQSTHEIIPDSIGFETETQKQEASNDERYFFVALKNMEVDINIKFKVKAEGIFHEYTPEARLVYFDNGKTIPIRSWKFQKEEGSILEASIDIDESIKGLLLPEGAKLSLFFYSTKIGAFFVDFTVYDFEIFNVRWNSKGKPVDIDVIDPNKLLLAFLDRMSGEKGKYKGWIHFVETNTIKLCAAESVRGIENAILHGSFKDFIEWLHVLGYEYYFSNEYIVFERRDYYYSLYPTALELGEGEVSNLRIEANPEFAYTKIEVGYEKQDYSNSNGRFEVNGTFDYSTGYAKAKENILSLISPYRADSVGLEMLVWKRNENTTDNKGDNDIFVVQLAYTITTKKYHYADEGRMTVEGIKIYNGLLNPHYLAKRNEDIIGINSKRIIFEGTSSNRIAKIDEGFDLYQDIDIEKGLFKPFTYHFNTGNHLMLPKMNMEKAGLVVFKYKGKLYRGYIYEITKYYGSEKYSEWTLYAYD